MSVTFQPAFGCNPPHPATTPGRPLFGANHVIVPPGQDTVSFTQTAPVAQVAPITPDTVDNLVSKLTEAVDYMSRRNIGGLIVVETKPCPETDRVTEHGENLDSELSAKLIATIFDSNTPLHDGALIIDHNMRIAEACAHLPSCNAPNLPWNYGHRHRAAIGLSEKTDDIVVLVSERTGQVKLVERGMVHELKNAQEFPDAFRKLYNQKTGL
ncbi:MAG: diadenylate cyclase [Candidatus Melainabacteria bacterium]